MPTQHIRIRNCKSMVSPVFPIETFFKLGGKTLPMPHPFTVQTFHPTINCPKELVLVKVTSLHITVFITLHACARGRIIRFVCLYQPSVVTKIARSGDLGIIVRCKYHYSVANHRAQCSSYIIAQALVHAHAHGVCALESSSL